MPPKTTVAGHAAHTQSADHGGLSGQMTRRIKLTFLGAGSMFTPRLVSDLLAIPGNHGGTIALVDIDAERLRTMEKLVGRLVEQLGQRHWRLLASVDRRAVLRQSDYVVNCIEVNGAPAVRPDYQIPKKYGIDQCIGDTAGPGGVFKALRTIPVWLEILRDCERLCPEALVLNYTNPMAMMCLAAGRTSPLKVVGLCHSVQGTSHHLARRAGVPYEELDWECAGINHLAWFTRLEHRGRDLYPTLKAMARADQEKALAEGPPRRPKQLTPHKWDIPSHHRDLVRRDMMLHFGAFITESSGHLSEYLPYYRKRRDLLRRYTRPGYDGGSGYYASNWPKWRAEADRERRDLLRGRAQLGWERSWEYASWIIEAREKDVPFRIHGNVMNVCSGAGPLIANLPANSCVEVACMVDGNDVHGTRFGSLPPQMAALCAANLAVFDLGAQAAIERSKEMAIHAVMLDPLSAAVCSPAEIRDMVVEMFAAEKRLLPSYR